MKQRRILLTGFAFVVIGVVAVLVLVSRNTPVSGVPLTAQFVAYTNNTRGGYDAILTITNHSTRKIAYLIYAPQQLGPNGWPQELPMASYLIGHTLLPHARTNQLANLHEAQSPLRIPVQVYFPPTWRERTRERIQMAINARSLKALFQQQMGYAIGRSPENFVFSNELPPIDTADLMDDSEAQE